MSEQEKNDKKLSLDHEIRKLIAYAHQEYGISGVIHVKNAVVDTVKHVNSGNITINSDWVNQEVLIIIEIQKYEYSQESN